MKNYAIILASGTGERTGLNTPKQFLKIAGKTVIEHTLCVFENHKSIDEIIIVSHVDYISRVREIVEAAEFKKISKIIPGGDTRKDSSFNGICAIDEIYANVLIHDAVRPFLSSKIIDNCIWALKTHKAVDVAIPSADTIVVTDENNFIKDIPKRNFFRRGQTPQCFYLPIIKQAHLMSQNDQNPPLVTDDCSLVLSYGLADVFIVEGDDFNRKITYPLDVAIADKLFQLKSIEADEMDFRALRNRVLVVFGYSKGIGKEVCEIARVFGAKVYGFSRKNGCDISRAKDISDALNDVFDKEKRIDYVVNTAGVLKISPLELQSESDINDEILTNYVGSINVARESLKYLKQSRGALLFYTSSSYTRGRADYSIYSSTKAAIVNLTQALSDEWEPFGVRVNAINPERTATQMRFENFGSEPKDTLLCPGKVARVSINAILSQYTGQVINVTRNDIL